MGRKTDRVIGTVHRGQLSRRDGTGARVEISIEKRISASTTESTAVSLIRPVSEGSLFRKQQTRDRRASKNTS